MRCMADGRRTLVALAVAGVMGLIVAGCGSAGPKLVPAPAAIRVIPALPTSTVKVLPNLSPTPLLVQTATPLPSTLPAQPASVLPSVQVLAQTVLPTVEHAASVTATRANALVQESRTGLPAPTSAPAAPTAQPPAATSTERFRPPLPPRSGGEWDMEAGFVSGTSPLSE